MERPVSQHHSLWFMPLFFSLSEPSLHFHSIYQGHKHLFCLPHLSFSYHHTVFHIDEFHDHYGFFFSCHV